MRWFFRNALIGLLIMWLAISVFGLLFAVGFGASWTDLARSPGAWLLFGGPWIIVAGWALQIRLRH